MKEIRRREKKLEFSSFLDFVRIIRRKEALAEEIVPYIVISSIEGRWWVILGFVRRRKQQQLSAVPISILVPICVFLPNPISASASPHQRNPI